MNKTYKKYLLINYQDIVPNDFFKITFLVQFLSLSYNVKSLKHIGTYFSYFICLN